VTPAAALAALVLAQLSVDGRGDLPLPESPPLEVWASEEWPADSLAAAAALPRAALMVKTRSNMLRPEVAAVLAGRREAGVRIALPLLTAHVEQLRGLPRLTIAFSAPRGSQGGLPSELGRLGPQSLRAEVDRLDEERARLVSELRNAEVELDARGRVPDQEEISRLRRLTRARRVIRLQASDPPELIAGLLAAKPARLVVESVDDLVPEPMRAALAQAGVPVRVSLSCRAQASDVRRLGALPGLSLELRLDEPPESALRKAAALLREIGRSSL
jgi:hypothetical protein